MDKTLHDLLQDIHTQLALLPVSIDKYSPISSKLLQAKEIALKYEGLNEKLDSTILFCEYRLTQCNSCPEDMQLTIIRELGKIEALNQVKQDLNETK